MRQDENSWIPTDIQNRCLQNKVSHTTYPAHLILIYLITPIIYGESAHYEAPLYAISSIILLLPLRRKYPQRFVLRHPSYMFSLNVRDQCLNSFRATGTIIVLCIFIFRFFGRRREDIRF